MFVDLSDIAGRFDRVDWLKPDPPGLAAGEKLVRVKAGTTMKELARLILPEMQPPLGLINTGTFDGQTLAGAISTGTHGTGIGSGGLADMVVSMDIVTVTKDADGSPDVRMRRIEPTDGVTDPAAFDRDRAEHGMLLSRTMICSTPWSSASAAWESRTRTRSRFVANIGCEKRWNCFRGPYCLRSSAPPPSCPGGAVPNLADGARHVWFMLNIAEMQGENKTQSPACFVVTRDIADAEVETGSLDWTVATRRARTISGRRLHRILGSVDPREPHDGLGETIRNSIVRTDVGEPAFKGNRWSSVSYIVHRREQEDRNNEDPPEPPPLALSTEIAVPAADIVTAVNAAIGCVEQSEIFYIAPFGVRFFTTSKHYLSPAYERATAWLEVAILLPAPLFRPQETSEEVRDLTAKPELEKIEAALCYQETLDGRTHLGKHNTVDRSRLEVMFQVQSLAGGLPTVQCLWHVRQRFYQPAWIGPHPARRR